MKIFNVNEMIDKNLVIVCVTVTVCLLFILSAFGTPPTEGVLGFAREALAGLFGIVTGYGGARVKDAFKKSKENKQETSATK